MEQVLSYLLSVHSIRWCVGGGGIRTGRLAFIFSTVHIAVSLLSGNVQFKMGSRGQKNRC